MAIKLKLKISIAIACRHRRMPRASNIMEISFPSSSFIRARGESWKWNSSQPPARKQMIYYIVCKHIFYNLESIIQQFDSMWRHCPNSLLAASDKLEENIFGLTSDNEEAKDLLVRSFRSDCVISFSCRSRPEKSFLKRGCHESQFNFYCHENVVNLNFERTRLDKLLANDWAQ